MGLGNRFVLIDKGILKFHRAIKPYTRLARQLKALAQTGGLCCRFKRTVDESSRSVWSIGNSLHRARWPHGNWTLEDLSLAGLTAALFSKTLPILQLRFEPL